MVGKATSFKFKILALYRSNYNAQYHVRAIAKLLDKSHVTILPYLKDLETEAVLTAKTIGRNKLYLINNESIIAKKYLILAEVIETITFLKKQFLIKTIVTEIQKQTMNTSIILFGSYAKKTQTKESDIDLFVLGTLTQKERQYIKKIGTTYAKMIAIKQATVKQVAQGLREKDPLLIEIN